MQKVLDVVDRQRRAQYHLVLDVILWEANN